MTTALEPLPRLRLPVRLLDPVARLRYAAVVHALRMTAPPWHLISRGQRWNFRHQVDDILGFALRAGWQPPGSTPAAQTVKRHRPAMKDSTRRKSRR